MVLNAKLVARSTTKISLNDRFTELRKIVPTIQPAPPPPPTTTRVAPPPPPSHYYDSSPGQRPRFDHPYQPGSRSGLPHSSSDDYYDSPPPSRYDAVGRNWSLAERIAEGMYLPRRRPAFEAALKIKRKSLKQRLGGGNYYGGFRGRSNGGGSFWSYNNHYREGSFRGWRPRYGFRGRGGNFRRSRSFQNLDRRWGSSTSLASDGTGFRRRSYSGSSGRGFRTWGRGGNRGGGGNFRGPREQISREELDKQLDEYMSGTQNVIDANIDA